MEEYIEFLQRIVYEKISIYITENTLDHILNVDLYESHILNRNSAAFQEYYFRILNNEELFLLSNNFFRDFKTNYSLQGIDRNYLDQLETHKDEILDLIRQDKLVQLYFNYFYKVQIQHGNNFIEKNLSSFFAKLVHTFRPNEFCALDNPIKDYFGLRNESFFISFYVISTAYKKWSNVNRHVITDIRNRFKELDANFVMNHDMVTDLKLLDLIFWSKANRG